MTHDELIEAARATEQVCKHDAQLAAEAEEEAMRRLVELEMGVPLHTVNGMGVPGEAWDYEVASAMDDAMLDAAPPVADAAPTDVAPVGDAPTMDGAPTYVAQMGAAPTADVAPVNDAPTMDGAPTDVAPMGDAPMDAAPTNAAETAIPQTPRAAYACCSRCGRCWWCGKRYCVTHSDQPHWCAYASVTLSPPNWHLYAMSTSSRSNNGTSSTTPTHF